METSPPFGRSALHWFADRTNPSYALEGRWHAPDWRMSADALGDVFDLRRGSHFLKRPAGVLPRLPEVQATGALRALILNSPDRTLERSQALFDALLGKDAIRLRSIARVTAETERRIDLAVHAIAEDGNRHCLAIEAKFDYEISDGQLKRYSKALTPEYPDLKRRHLFVVAPARTKKTNDALSLAENQEWRFASWRRTLLAWQRALPDDAGADADSLFAEIWKRAGGC